MRTLLSSIGARVRRDGVVRSVSTVSNPPGDNSAGAIGALSNPRSAISQFGTPPPGGMSYRCLDPDNGLPWPGVRAVGAQGAVLRRLEFVLGESSAVAFEALQVPQSRGGMSKAADVTRHDLDAPHARGRGSPVSRFSGVYGTAIPQSYLDMRAKVQDKKSYDAIPVLLLAPNDSRSTVAVVTPQMRAQGAGLTGMVATDVFNLLNLGFGVAIDAVELTDLGPALTSQLSAIAREASQIQGRKIVFFNAGQQNQAVADWITRAGEPALVIADSRAAALALAAK